MINDREVETKIKKYASENHYTILANTLGALEYVKYCYKDFKTTSFLKWAKGSDTFTITKKGKIKKINIEDIG